MKSKCYRFGVRAALVLLLAASCAAVSAQDDADEDEGRGRFFASGELYAAQAVGLNFEPATRVDPTNPFGATVLSPEHGTEGEFRYRVGFEMSRNLGALVVTWYSHDEEVALSEFAPGDFVFGQTLSPSVLAGFANDGLADAFTSQASTTLRDMRIDFYRTAFRNDRVHGKWFIGLRRVKHGRESSAEYFGLVPPFPALIPPFSDPRPDLDPLPERAELRSYFSGRGLGGGLEVEMPLLSGRLTLDTGVSLAILRGDIESSYRATVAYYTITDPITSEVSILLPPYDEFSQLEVLPGAPVATPVVDRIGQEEAAIGVRIDSRSAAGEVIEAHVGLRWKAWRELELFGGFRNAYYTNVGHELTAEAQVTIGGSNAGALTEKQRSVNYEGWYGGLAVRF